MAEAVYYAADVKPGETIREGSQAQEAYWNRSSMMLLRLKRIELDPRRADVLKALGDVVNDDTFKVKAKADVVVGNPFLSEAKARKVEQR